MAYVEYCSLPLTTSPFSKDPAIDPHTNEIYSNHWCVHTGKSFVAPHPHRRFTFIEFKNRWDNDEKLRERFTKKD